MFIHIYLLIILVPFALTTHKSFHRYQPLIFRPVVSVEDVNNKTSSDITNIYVESDHSSSRFKLTVFGHSLTVVLVKPAPIDASKPQIKVYGDELKVYNTSELKVNHFVGRVLESPGSFVEGTIRNYVFTGIIQTKSTVFYIEPYHRHFNNSTLYNAFIYEPENPYIRHCHDGECDSIYANVTKRKFSTKFPYDLKSLLQENHSPKNQVFDLTMDPKIQYQTEAKIEDNVGKICEVVAVADHTFYDFHLRTLANLIEGTTEVISAVNREFEQMDFNGDGKPDHMSILYAGTEVYKRPTGQWGSGLANNLTQEELLIAFSRLMKKNPYCLAILFTARDFSSNNTGPGLAFTAVSNPRGPDGGICSLPAKYGSPIDGEARLNTLLVSFIHEGQVVPFSSMVVNLLHQIGHSFGSYHDAMSERSCTPNDEGGDFVMYPELHQEKLPNSRRFSSCSVSRMLPVIRNKGWCLKGSSDFPGGKWFDRCGNGVVNDREVCDCGLGSSCQQLDPCCRPPGDIHGCTLMPGVSCSPSVHACCSPHCSFKDPGVACAAQGDPECSSYGVCSGTDACIHMAAVQGNSQACGHGEGRCENGICVSVVCEQNGRKPCQCELPANHRCHVCCIAEDGSCKSAMAQGIRKDNGSPYLIPRGRPCYEGMGTCSSSGVCEVAIKENVTDRILFGYRRLKVQTDSRWPTYLAYVLMALVFFLLLIFLVLGFIITSRRARFLRRFRETCLESKRRIKEGGQDWDLVFQRMRLDDWSKNRVIRLYALFPDASPGQILEASNDEEEEDAVRGLLNHGLPIRRKFHVPWPPGSLVKPDFYD